MVFFQSADDNDIVLYRKIEQDIKVLLSEVLGSDEVFLAALQQWSAKYEEYYQSSDTVSLLVPQFCRRLKRQVMDLLQKERSWKIHIEYHDDNRFVIRFKDRVAEFCPEEVSDIMTATLLKKYPDYPRDNLSESALQQLREILFTEEKQGLHND